MITNIHAYRYPLLKVVGFMNKRFIWNKYNTVIIAMANRLFWCIIAYGDLINGVGFDN